MKPRHKQSMKSLALVLLTAFAVLIATTVYGDSQKSDTYEGLKLFSDVLEEIENNYVESVESKELIEEAINGMVNSLDPHSNFLPPDAFDNLQEETKGEFGGIGIVITKRDGRLTVVSPVEGTPAYKAGVQANDVIVKVGDKATKDMMLWEAVKLLRGEEGTEVDITVVREGAAEPMEFTLVREVIPLESVRYVNLKPGYGYLWVTNFRENSTDEISKALADLEKQNDPMKGLILDLRDNPGGLLNQAVSVSDIFLEEGKIVSIRGRDKEEEDVYRAEDGADHDYPIVVLINGGSASAAEIVAGALQDNGRALVIGTTSFGKGSVQTVQPLRNGYALKYTIARYYTPSGTSIQADGIHPDLVVQRRLLDETKSGMEAARIKEEDLKNHLAGTKESEEAVPDSETPTPEEEKQQPDKEDIQKKEREKLMRLRDALYEHGDKDPEVLLLDSQINRAYEILKGYEIFQGLQKN
ncbi:MAG: S41 family peptidase [Thermodesulfobacteriota bacterium]